MSATPAAGLDPAAVNPDQTNPSSTVLINDGPIGDEESQIDRAATSSA